MPRVHVAPHLPGEALRAARIGLVIGFAFTGVRLIRIFFSRRSDGDSAGFEISDNLSRTIAILRPDEQLTGNISKRRVECAVRIEHNALNPGRRRVIKNTLGIFGRLAHWG